MAITRRLVLLLAPLSVLAAEERKKDRYFAGGTIKVVELAVHRSNSDPLLLIDGRIVNSGTEAISELVLIFEVTGMDNQILSSQRGKVEEDPLGPAEESEFHWQMRDHANAVELRVRAVAHHERAVKVEEPGPYPIE